MNMPEASQDTPISVDSYAVLMAKAQQFVTAEKFGPAARAFERAGGLAQTDLDKENAFTLAAAAFVLIGNESHALDDLHIAESFDSSHRVS